MPLARTADLIERARHEGVGLGAFNVICLEHAEAIAEGSARAGRPVIMQVSENAARFRGSFGPITDACAALARAAETDVAVHLDHVQDTALLDDLDTGAVSSVMIDASTADYAVNVATTRGVVDWGHQRGLWVEAELGQVGGKGGAPALGAHQPGARTDPDDAARYVAATGVDGLAVAVGSVHAMTTRTAVLDLDLVAALRARVDVPLVLHGSSGVSAETLADAVASGIVKVNIGTALNMAFTAAVRSELTADPDQVDPRHYLAPAREAMAAVVADAAQLLFTTDSSPAR